MILTHKNTLLSIVGASLVVLVTALIMEHGFGIVPCTLCQTERMVYITTAIIAAVGLFAPPKTKSLLLICGIVFFMGFLVSAYHVGIQEHWISPIMHCTPPSGEFGQSVADLRTKLLATPTVRCDVVDWALFGISLAGYNVIASLLLAGFAFYSYRQGVN